MVHITKYGTFEKEYMNQRGMLLSGDELHGLDTAFKVGHNDSIGTTYAVVSEGGLCRLPAPSNATTLRIKAGGHANDTAAGSGARSVMLLGCDPAGVAIQEILATNGALASLSTTQEFIRLDQAVVLETGVYPENLLTGGQASTITIENTAGTEDWIFLRFNGFADCQSQQSCLAVGAGKRAYLTAMNLFVDTNKQVDFLLVFRNNFLNESTITPVRVGAELNGIEGSVSIPFVEPPRFPEFTDIGLLAKVTTGTAKVSASMTYIMGDVPPSGG